MPPSTARLGLALVVGCAALVLTGAVATASGQHAGDSSDVSLAFTVAGTLSIHVRAAAVAGIAFALLLAYLVARRRDVGRLLPAALVLLGLLLVQMAVGELQWRNRLPWWLVLVHVSLAGAVWAWCVALVTALWRPPRPLAAGRA